MLIEPVNFWIIVGILLMIGEMLSASFFMIFIALGCFAAALLASFDVNFPLQIMTCAAVSVVGTLSLRKSIQARLRATKGVKSDIGTEIRIETEIGAHQQGRVSYQGTQWQATNVASEALKPGDHACIVGIDGNTLLIRKVD